MRTLKKASIRKIEFNLPGKITIKLEDGRILIVPVSMFPEIKKMSVAGRRKCTIVDDRTLLFRESDKVYHLEDFMGTEENWKSR